MTCLPTEQLQYLSFAFATGDSLPVFLARYRRLIACFSGPLQETIACFFGPSSLTFSAKSAILELKGVKTKISPCV